MRVGYKKGGASGDGPSDVAARHWQARTRVIRGEKRGAIYFLALAAADAALMLKFRGEPEESTSASKSPLISGFLAEPLVDEAARVPSAAMNGSSLNASETPSDDEETPGAIVTLYFPGASPERPLNLAV